MKTNGSVSVMCLHYPIAKTEIVSSYEGLALQMENILFAGEVALWLAMTLAVNFLP